MFDKKQYLGKFCDIQTKDGVWRLGTIEGDKVNKMERLILDVTLDGWSSNKNQKICIHSNRIQPPRYYSREYTGQKSHPLRNSNIDMVQISYIENWLKLFYKFDFQKFPVLDITNLFRCQMFILVDSILFFEWEYFTESIEEDLKKIESFFNNIVQFSVLYLENMPKFISEIYNAPYERHSYLKSLPVSYLEASYEIFKILKSIFGFSERTNKFFQQNSEIIKTNFLNYFIDIGCMNLFSRFFREYKQNKLFEEKFYILSNILTLNLQILNKANHHKLNKANQLKYITEIVDFLYRENFIGMINKNIEDPDSIELVDSIVEFAKSNQKFVRESQRFEIFLHNINKFDLVFQDERKASDNTINIPQPTYLKTFNQFVLSANPSNNISNYNNENFLTKLNDIDNKLSNLENRINSQSLNKNSNKNFHNQFQKSTTSEFFFISPRKSKTKREIFYEQDEDFVEINNLDDFLLNSPSSFFSVSDPFDEFAILNVIERNLKFEEKCDKNFLLKIILWRKKILEISKCNGWIVGKILAASSVKKFEINDRDIIQANLIYMEKFNMINKQNFRIDHNEILKEYEDMLINSLKEM